MSAADAVRQISDRHMVWYGRNDGVPETDAAWPHRDPDETAEHYIIRNDVPTMADALDEVLDLHYQEYGTCAHCTNESAVPWPCATVRIIDRILGAGT